MILVNGASGALGQRVVEQAQHLHGADAVLRGYRRAQTHDARWRHIDDNGTIDKNLLRAVDTIINCAGAVRGSEEIVRQANVVHASNLAKTAKQAGVRRFVQVSSFAVYGDIEHIDATTPVDPQTLYARSKLEAEAALGRLNGSGFSTVNVRLPFMFDARQPALMARLIRLMHLLPVLPVSARDTQRSVISYPAAASVLLNAAQADLTGAICAADPEPFRYALLARLMREAGLRTAALVPVPAVVEQILNKVSPALSRRLLHSSLLDRNANFLFYAPDGHGLKAEIRQVLRTL